MGTRNRVQRGDLEANTWYKQKQNTYCPKYKKRFKSNTVSQAKINVNQFCRLGENSITDTDLNHQIQVRITFVFAPRVTYKKCDTWFPDVVVVLIRRVFQFSVKHSRPYNKHRCLSSDTIYSNMRTTDLNTVHASARTWRGKQTSSRLHV